MSWPWRHRSQRIWGRKGAFASVIQSCNSLTRPHIRDWSNHRTQAMFSLPPVTRALILANGLAFLLEAMLGDAFAVPLALWPFGAQFMPWQMLTYAFLHANFPHLLFNMFAVYMFGADLERVWGPRRFLSLYLVSAVAAAIAQLLVSSLTGAYY